MQAACMEFHTNNLFAVKWDSRWKSSHLSGFYTFPVNPDSMGFLSMLCMIASEPRADYEKQANLSLSFQLGIWQQSHNEMQTRRDNKPMMMHPKSLFGFV